MGCNRKYPFGYQMKFGEIVLHPEESETVRWIYQQYLTGASYGKLADVLRQHKMMYHKERTWNKNMVARILDNKAYMGTSEFPAIISVDDFRAVHEQRDARAVPTKKTPIQKELRRLCGFQPPEYVGTYVLGILNTLIRQPERIRSPLQTLAESGQTRELHQHLSDALQNPPVDEEKSRKLTFQLAASRLNEIGSEEYETYRLRRILADHQPAKSIDAELLQICVRKISFQNEQAIVQLKNGQLIERWEEL